MYNPYPLGPCWTASDNENHWQLLCSQQSIPTIPEPIVEEVRRQSDPPGQILAKPQVSDVRSTPVVKEITEVTSNMHEQSVPPYPLNNAPPIITEEKHPAAPLKPEALHGPPFPTQERLHYVPVDLCNTRVEALLDADCSENFLSETAANQLRLTRYPLKMAIGIQMVNGETTYVNQFVRPIIRIGALHVRLALKVFENPFSLIIGYPFLRMLRAKPDWTARMVELSHRGLTYSVQVATVPSGMTNVIRKFGSSLREVPLSSTAGPARTLVTPEDPSVIEPLHQLPHPVTENLSITSSKPPLKIFDSPCPMNLECHFLLMPRLKPVWLTRMVELSHRGLMYSVQAATGMIKDISDLATSLWESPSSRVSGSEETPVPERQAVTVLPYPINNVSVEAPPTAISNLISSAPEPLHTPHQDNNKPLSITNPPPSVSKPLHPPHQPDTGTLSITISNPLSKVFASLTPMTP